MIADILKENDIKSLRGYIHNYNDIIITCHVSPDGDAVGACLALCHLLRGIGKNSIVILPDQAPKNLSFLHGYRGMLPYTMFQNRANVLIEKAELIFCLDFNALYRVDKLYDSIEKATAKKVLIDHHLDPEQFCDITMSYSIMSSTCELLFRVIKALNMVDLLDEKSAECIYAGMMTDTGNFSYNSNRAGIYTIISELIGKGIDKDKIYRLVMNTSTESRLRLIGYSIYDKMEVYSDSSAALITLTQEELKRFDYKKGDTEMLVNIPLGIPEVKWVIFMREEDGYIKISARSKGDFAVNKICEQYFGGGGHKNASGGEFRGSLEDAVATYHRILENLKNN